MRRFLVQHPALVWALGFPLHLADTPHGFDANASLPSTRHFNRVLRALPNEHLQSLLDAQVSYLQQMLPPEFGRTISLDTKHILAWTKQNNPKAFVKEGRFDKAKQPAADPDCKLGCKRRRNQITPTTEGQPATGLRSVGEFYWGYASGAVVTKLPGYGEFVLAELTQTFDKGDTTYFLPLMQQVERRLGFKPTFGALDAAFDAFYVYDYFHQPDEDGFAAVPLNQPGGIPRRFHENGLPLCAAGLPMPLRKKYTDRTKTIVVHERAFYACPLLFPDPSGECCPIQHKRWPKGGCSAQMPTAIGARLRHQLDRDSDRYKHVYDQRTAVERIFSQALDVGIERPKLRNANAIANQNTLIYLLLNVRATQRLLAQNVPSTAA
jgi:hypothetical protein